VNETVLLVSTVALPLLAAVVVLALRRARAAAVAVAAAASTLTLVAALALLRVAPPWRQGPDAASLDLPWIGLLGSRLHLGWDGITAPLVVLTAVLVLLSVVYLWVSDDDGQDDGQDSDGAYPDPLLLVCLLLVEAGAVATFTARDLLVFFIGFETVLVPMWFIIAAWGDPVRRRGAQDGPAARSAAASRFVIYTATGSAIMLLGLVLLAVQAGTSDLVELARTGPQLDLATQSAVALLLLVGLGVKVPVWPLHSWLPAAHTIAPTVGSVLLAGVLLKLGSYGMVRLVAGVVPDGLARWAPWLAALGVGGILWGALVCLVERDLKRLIAFSSVAHMGFVVVGVASGTPEGLQGALFAGVAHGVVTSLLFWTVGMLKHRRHSADLADLGTGLRDRMPRLGWVLALGAVAGVGLPGLAGFWGEILAVVGAWKGEAFLGPTGAVWVAVLSAVGTALAAAYLMRVLYLLWHGDARPGAAVPGAAVPGAAGLHGPDMTVAEASVLAPLVVGCVALGVLPWLLLSVTGPAVRQLLGGVG